MPGPARIRAAGHRLPQAGHALGEPVEGRAKAHLSDEREGFAFSVHAVRRRPTEWAVAKAPERLRRHPIRGSPRIAPPPRHAGATNLPPSIRDPGRDRPEPRQRQRARRRGEGGWTDLGALEPNAPARMAFIDHISAAVVKCAA